MTKVGGKVFYTPDKIEVLPPIVSGVESTINPGSI